MRRLFIALRLLVLISMASSFATFAYDMIRYGAGWNWRTEWEYYYGNRVAIGAGLMLMITAAIRTAPPTIPRTVDELWTWGMAWAHTFWNLPQNPPPPAAPLLRDPPASVPIAPTSPAPAAAIPKS